MSETTHDDDGVQWSIDIDELDDTWEVHVEALIPQENQTDLAIGTYSTYDEEPQRYHLELHKADISETIRTVSDAFANTDGENQ
jgi:hypothetical protein